MVQEANEWMQEDAAAAMNEESGDDDDDMESLFNWNTRKTMHKSFRPKTMRLDWWEASDEVKKSFVKKLFPEIDLGTIFENNECTICMTDKPSGMFLPCKHVVVCKSCRLADTFKKCHVCRR